MQSNSSAPPPPPPPQEAVQSAVSYEIFRRVLLLGEADYSFTRAFACAMMTTTKTTSSSTSTSPMELTATEYGSPTEIASRYYTGDIVKAKTAISNIQELTCVTELMCNLNARRLGKSHQNDTNNECCMCQRWNSKTHDWDEPSNFWNDSNTTNSHKYDLIVFNFPHSDQAGRAGKLIRALFKQLRICIDDNRLPSDVVLEMRLRFIPTLEADKKNIRSYYQHEQAAQESQFRLIGTWKGDLEKWEDLGYQHKMTKKNTTCRDIGKDCSVWRWTSE